MVNPRALQPKGQCSKCKHAVSLHRETVISAGNISMVCLLCNCWTRRGVQDNTFGMANGAKRLFDVFRD